MDATLAHALRLGHGLLTRSAVDARVPAWAFDNACRSGALRRVLPGVYVDAARLRDHDLRRRAALAYAGSGAALSHTTALDQWGLHRQPDDAPVHVTVRAASALRSRDGVSVHRSRDFGPDPPVVARRGLAVTHLDRSLVDAWPLLPPGDRREPVIRAVNDRMTTPGRIAAALARSPRLAARAELRDLVALLAAGCRSALEIWGHDHVFAGPGLPTLRRQHPVRLGDRIVFLDVYAERERVGFELDGAAFHGDPEQREADLCRDAALAALGIQVVRFSHRRLVREPGAVRREVLAVLATRRL